MVNKFTAGAAPAVVIGGQLNGLGVTRSLSTAEVPTVVVDTGLHSAAMWSRGSRNYIVNQMFGRPFVDDLLTLQAKIGVSPVLILADEIAVDTVSEHRAELASCYRFRLPSRSMVVTLGNKELFQCFAETHRLPVPRTIVVKSESDITKLQRLGLPVIVKPADKLQFHLGHVERLNLVSAVEEAGEVCRRLLQRGITPVVQEWIDGRDSDIYFALFYCGSSPASKHIFVGRKIAARPPGVGSTAVCVAAPEMAELLRPLVEKFIGVSEYQGLGSLEFKWSPQARQFVIIEPTVGRTDWQEEIATLNGLNLPLVAYRHELGLPMPEQRRVDAVAWRDSFRSVGLCSGLGRRTYDGYWRIDDPLPALVYWINLAFRAFCRLLQRRAWAQRRSAGIDPPGDATRYVKERAIHDDV